MIIMAFLQNAWFKPGTPPRHLARFRCDQDFRRRVISRSYTGKRLVDAFGADLYGQILWWDCTEEIGQVSTHKAKPDFTYINNAIIKCKPDLILTFGTVATAAIRTLQPRAPVMSTAHPAARNKYKCEKLNLFAQRVKRRASLSH